MKYVLVILVAFTLLGCEARTPQDRTLGYILPEELKDCKIFRINDGMNGMYITRCPKSDTSTEWLQGKYSQSSSVIEE